MLCQRASGLLLLVPLGVEITPPVLPGEDKKAEQILASPCQGRWISAKPKDGGVVEVFLSLSLAPSSEGAKNSLNRLPVLRVAVRVMR